MNPDFMRKIDRLLGIPLCFLLSMWKALTSFKKCPQNTIRQHQTKILFLKLSEIGASLLSYPALKNAEEYWPECEIFFLVFAENKKSVSLLSEVGEENVFTIRSHNLLLFLFDICRRIVQIRRMKLDVVIDLEFFSRVSAILVALFNARAAAGFDRFTMEGLYRGNNIFSHPVQFNPHLHVALSYLSLVEALGQEKPQVPYLKLHAPEISDLELPHFKPNPGQIKHVREMIHNAHPDVQKTDKLIILNVNASELLPLRRWPLEHFIELGRRFLENQEVFLIFIGIEPDMPDACRVIEALGSQRCVNFVGKTSLTDLLTLFSICDLMVTNDSGPPHFACLTDLPTLTFFGPETPEVFGPLGKNKVSISSGLFCSPCVSALNHRNSPCDNNICMQQLSVDTVYGACEELLRRVDGGIIG